MKVIILGAGRVGESVAEHLVSEHNDITVIDQSPGLLARLQQRFDLRCIAGNGILPSVLEDAGIADADLLLACAADDAVNLTACKTAHKMFGVPRRIARLRSPEWMAPGAALLGAEGFAVDQAIYPEESITRYVHKLVEYPEALQVREFAGGLAALVSARAVEGAPMTGQPIRAFESVLPGAVMRIVAIYRRFSNEADRFVPRESKTVILPGDEVFFVADRSHIRDVLACLSPAGPPVRRVMIAGGGHVGLRLTQSLQGRLHVKLIEIDPQRCEMLAAALGGDVLVLQGDATDENLLGEENINEIDLFCALTNADEDNIMAGLLAKQLGATRVISLVNRRSYADLVHGTQIDIALSPSQTMMGELLAHIRQGDVYAVYSVRRGKAEAIELAVHGERGSSRVIGRRICDLALPEGVQIGLVVRGLPDLHHVRASTQAPPREPLPPQVLPATRDTVLQEGDHVIIYLPHRRQVRMVEKLFRVSATFF